VPYSDYTGTRIYYEVAGEGPAMVLVHANPFDHRLWLYQVARFSPFYKVIAVDLRGYGRSNKPDTPFTLQDMAEDVVGVCRAEGVERAIFCGVSVGSGISLLISLDHPDLVEALVLVGGSSRGARSMDARIAGFLSDDLPAYHRQHLKDCVEEHFPEKPLGAWLLGLFNDRADELSGRCIAQIFRARLACDMRPRLQNVRAATLVINGEHDMSLAAGRETASLVPGAVHTVLPGTGHACNIEDPAGFDAKVITFLDGLGLWRGPR
jgi:pimeloyl-ACP methyl ester carboxylesterase